MTNFKKHTLGAWHFAGRLRNKTRVLMDDTDTWQLSSSFFEQATGKPSTWGMPF